MNQEDTYFKILISSTCKWWWGVAVGLFCANSLATTQKPISNLQKLCLRKWHLCILVKNGKTIIKRPLGIFKKGSVWVMHEHEHLLESSWPLPSEWKCMQFIQMSSCPAAQCTLHHTCEMGQRHSQQERDVGMLGLRPPSSRDINPPVMDNILQEVTAIRGFLEKRDRCREIAKEWLQVGYVLDVLLFRVYLVAIVAYSITLGTLWSVWQVAWALLLYWCECKLSGCRIAWVSGSIRYKAVGNKGVLKK